LPWRGGALAPASDGHIDFWTSAGSNRLPVAADLQGTVATGPLGLVIVSLDDKKALVSRDGIDFAITPIPAKMADADGRNGPTVAVGDRTVLVLGWTPVDEFTRTPSLWLGTLES
jgi:hypothetical protein